MVVVIKHNSTMTQLDLSLNNLHTDDCNTLVEAIAGAALAEAIKHNSTVTQFDLSVNNLDTDHCNTLAKAIKHN